MIVNIAFGLLGDMQVSAADCYNNATPSGIESAKKEEASEYEAYKAKVKAEKDAEIKKEKEEEQKRIKANASNTTNTSGLASKIVSIAKKYSWPYGTSKSKWHIKYGAKSYNGYEQAFRNSKGYAKYDASTRRGTCCCHFSKFVISEALGGKKKVPNVLTNIESEDWKTDIHKIEKYGFTTMMLKKDSKVKAGDIIAYVKKSGGGHVVIVIGDGKIAQAGHSGAWPHISDFSVKKIYDKSTRGFIARPKS